MSTHVATRRLTQLDLARMRANGEKIAVLTCYDASFAQLCDAAGVDALLIGDSLGHGPARPRLDAAGDAADIAYHTASVARAAGVRW
jgi:3-methyl-2-oxobutanoate hydroxymethyltransferase